jgi:hypothetical protein
MIKTLVSALFFAAAILSTGCATQQVGRNSSANMPEITDVTSASAESPNWCVRSNKRYDCGSLVSVIRANGQNACRPATAPAEPGEKLCTGIK